MRFAIGLVLILVCLSASAALQSRLSGQAYYDDVLDVTWVADANLSATNPFGVSYCALNQTGPGCIGTGTVAGFMRLSTAQAWIAGMNTANYLGFNDWRLPAVKPPGPQACAGLAYSGTNCGWNMATASIDSEMAHMFYVTLGNTGFYSPSGTPNGCAPCLTNSVPFSNVVPDTYLYGSVDSVTSDPWLFSFYGGGHFTCANCLTGRAWAVRSGDVVAPAPPIAYVYNPNYAGNAIELRAIKATGVLSSTVTASFSTLPAVGPRDIVIDEEGKHAYVLGTSTVAVFSINPSNDHLTPVGSPVATGPIPTSMALDPNGTRILVCNQGDNTVFSYGIDRQTGGFSTSGTLVGSDTCETPIAATSATSLATPPSPTANHFLHVATTAGGGAVRRYSIDAGTGALGSPVSDAIADLNLANRPVSVVPRGELAYAVHSGVGIDALRIDPSTGAAAPVAGSPFPATQSGRAVGADPRGSFVYYTNKHALIDADSIVSAEGVLSAVVGSPFALNRITNAIASDPSGSFVYACGDDFTSNPSVATVQGYSIDRNSFAPAPIGIELTTGGTDCSSIAVDPSGRFVYVGDDAGVAAFRIDTSTTNTGELVPISVPGSPYPMSAPVAYIAMHPDGTYLYVLRSDNNLMAYAIDPQSGALGMADGPLATAAGTPAGLVVDSTATSSFVYAMISVNGDAGYAIYGYSVTPLTGVLGSVPGSPTAATDPGISMFVTP